MSESFSKLFENSETQQNIKPGALLMGTVVSMNREKAIINVGLKSEGFISLNEFKDARGELEILKVMSLKWHLNLLTMDLVIHCFLVKKRNALRCGENLS